MAPHSSATLAAAVLLAGTAPGHAQDAPPPAARDIRVVCDRWPDGSTLRRFALDAVRLSGAKTEKEKALAVFRWMRRWTLFTTGEAPSERGQQVLDDLKILNVYGAHWCDGRALLMETLWRSIGGRAYKLYVPDGYTMALVHWKDDDGVERWHQLHASRGWYVYDREGKWVATPDQIASDFSLLFRPSRTGIPRSGHPPRPWNWIAVGHRPFSTHDLTLDLRIGEAYVRQWGNEGIPLCDNVGTNQYADGEHGPYPITYGNGRLISPLDWSRGRPGPDGRLALLWPVRTPHVIADAWLQGPRPKDLTVEFFPDGTNRFPLAVGAQDRIELGRYAQGEKNALGRYEFPLRLTWTAAEMPSDPLLLTAVVQHNLFSLPQLWPGKNTITVSAALATGTALRVTYEWSDPEGQDKQNVTVVERTPHSYEVLAAGSRWTDVRCQSLTITAIPATGKGNRTEVKESAIRLQPPPVFPPMDDLVGDTKPPPLKPIEAYVADLADAAKRNAALDGLLVLRDPAAAPALTNLLQAAEAMPVETRGRICQAIALCLPPEEAFRALLPIVRPEDALPWPAGDGDARRTLASLVAHLAADANYRAAIPDLVAAYKRGVGRWNRPTFLRAFGRLRAQEAVPLCVAALSEHSDVSASAAWALGEIGDTSVVADLVKAVQTRLARSRFQAILYAEAADALGKLAGKTPEALALLEKLIRHEDEEVRGRAAEALGKVGGPGHAPLLLSAAEEESFPWGRERMLTAARAIAQREGKPVAP